MICSGVLGVGGAIKELLVLLNKLLNIIIFIVKLLVQGIRSVWRRLKAWFYYAAFKHRFKNQVFALLDKSSPKLISALKYMLLNRILDNTEKDAENRVIIQTELFPMQYPDNLVGFRHNFSLHKDYVVCNELFYKYFSKWIKLRKNKKNVQRN